MPVDVKELPPDKILEQLAQLFMATVHDRQVYCVFAPYAKLRAFQQRIKLQVESNGFEGPEGGRIEYISLNNEVFAHLKTLGKYDQAMKLADARRDDQLKALLSQTFRDLITRRIETPGVSGLILCDFELLYAYDLVGNDISIARQVAINGKRVCLLIPGVMRDGRLWIFDEDPESRKEFPDALVFKNSGWVFEIA